MTARSTAPRRVRADVTRNRAHLIDVARAYLDETGTMSHNAIAQRAGLGVGTVYRHFPTVEALQEAIGLAGLDELTQSARAALTETPAAGLRRLVAAAVDRALDDPAMAGLIACSEPSSEPARRAIAELMELCAQVLRRARSAGLVRPDITDDDLRRLICGLVHAVASGPDAGLGTGARQRYLDILLAGLSRSL